MDVALAIFVVVAAILFYFKLEKIMATMQDHEARLDAVTGKLGKVKAEVEKLIEEVRAGGNTSPAVDAAMDRVEAALAGVDDLNEDQTDPQS